MLEEERQGDQAETRVGGRQPRHATLFGFEVLRSQIIAGPNRRRWLTAMANPSMADCASAVEPGYPGAQTTIVRSAAELDGATSITTSSIGISRRHTATRSSHMRSSYRGTC